MPPGDAAWIGPYRVTRRLGAGGMGEVLLAYDPRLDRQVAIKRIRPDGAVDAGRRTRFRREARLAARLAHPNIVQVFDLLSDDGAEHIVMEHVPGSSLRETLASQGPPELARTVAIAQDVARALSYAHRHGVVHRDLKTENVLVGPAGAVKIADFGIARRLLTGGEPGDSESLTREGGVVGTLRAMSPEQARGEEVTPRSDLFALGVLLYELLTGGSPFHADAPLVTVTRILQHRPPPADSQNPRVPRELAALVEHLLEKDPLLRPRDADEVVERLRAIAARTPDPGAGATTLLPSDSGLAPPLPPPPRRRRWRLRAAVLVAAAVAGSGWLALRTLPPAVRSASPPVGVAVLEPAVDGATEARTLAFAVRSALLKHLSRLEGVYPKTRAEVDASSGTPLQIGRAVAADEALESTIRCRARRCQLELGIVDVATGRSRWFDHAEIPADDLLVATRAVQVLLGRAYGRREPVEGEGLEVHPDDFASYLEVHSAFGSRPEADGLPGLLARLAGIRERSPGFVDAYVLEAEIALRQHLETGDRAYLERALELGAHAGTLAPTSREVLFLRVRLDVAAGRPEAAAERLDRLESLIPGDPELLYHRTEVLFARGELRDALELARRIAERHPSSRYLYRHAALASRLGETARARAALATLLEQDPEHYDGRELLARLEMITGDLGKAAALYRELVAESRGPTELGNLGNVLMLLGRPAAAAGVFERLLERTPEDPRSVLNLADARALAGDAAGARRLYRRVLQELEVRPPPIETQALTVRAQALAHLGRGREAVAAAHGALQRAPGDAHVAYEAALVFAIAGERNSALASFARARELGFDAVWFRYPWFDPLRTDPGFERQVWGSG